MRNFVWESRSLNAGMVVVSQNHSFVTMREIALMRAMKAMRSALKNQKILPNAIKSSSNAILVFAFQSNTFATEK